MVMLHGLITGSLATWYYTAAPILAKPHTVILYDLRGHGLSEKAAVGYDTATQVRDLEAVIEAYTEGPVCLVGHSYGALIALKYTMTHPNAVSRLALIEIPLPPSTSGDFTAFIQQRPEDMVATLPMELQTLFGVSKRGRRLNRFLKSVQFLGLESSLTKDLAAEADIPDKTLTGVMTPTLGVFGTTSSCRPTGDRLLALMPNFTHVHCTGGHYLPLEAPQQLNAALESFCNG
jgi:pimeloyl-ACP methyl ester carboxylesterase